MKKENNPIVMTAIIAGVILVIAIMVLVTVNSVLPTSKNVVTVQGTSTIHVTPDLITVYYNIETKGTTSAAAKDANTLIYDKLKNTIETLGFDEGELKTQSYNIYPNNYWDSSSGKQRQDGYIASHSLVLEFSTEMADKLSGAIDAGANSGAGVSSINFELTTESQNKYKAEALRLASEDAQTKADAIASGFNKKAGKLVSVQVSEFGYYPWNLYTSSVAGGVSTDNAREAKDAVMNIAPNQQDITGSISATFALQ
jgi:uncharacterized protein YggE